MSFWAKSTGETLEEHTTNVVKNICLLLEKIRKGYLNKRSKTLHRNGLIHRIMNDSKSYKEFLDMCIWAAICHDLGKVYPLFQSNVVHNPDFYDQECLPNMPHSFISTAFVNIHKIEDFKKLSGLLGFRKNFREFLKIVLSTIAFHHWRDSYAQKLISQKQDIECALQKIRENGIYKNQEFRKQMIDFLQNLQKKLSSLKSLKGIRNLKKIKLYEYIEPKNKNLKLNDVCTKLLIPPDNMAFLPRQINLTSQINSRSSDKSEKQRNFFILLKGFLHRADHFASSDIYSSRKYQIEKDPLSPKQIEQKIKQQVKKRTGYKGRLWQEEILRRIPRIYEKNVFLKAPTGVGKTEFALLWSKGRKVIYVLPIRAAVNAMWKRLRNIFGKDNVGILHSDSLFYIDDIKDHKRDESVSESLMSNDLARNLSYPVIVATADQFFVSALKYPGYEKIYSTLSYSYVIIDEIQMYEPRIAAMMIKALEEINKLGGRFCIMSATLPKFYKKELKERKVSYVSVEYGNKRIKTNANYLNVKKHKIEIIDECIVEKQDGRQVKVNQGMLDKIKHFVDNGKRVLVVLNTIEAAKHVYKAIEELKGQGKSVLLIHSQFTLSDRKRKEEQFEKGGSNRKSGAEVLVSTQIVEASLDIDYDVLFTELAPLDSLIQRMGRILRRQRNKYLGEANIYIYAKIEGAIGVDTVYREVLLKETLEILTKKLKRGKLLSEKDKLDLVERFYEKLWQSDENQGQKDEKGKNKKGYEYTNDFRKMISILDSLYSADSKKEAQNIFRDIIQICGVPLDKIKEGGLEGRIKELIKDDIINLLREHYEFLRRWREEWRKSGSNKQKKVKLREKYEKRMKNYIKKLRKIKKKVYDLIQENAVYINYPRRVKVQKRYIEIQKRYLSEYLIERLNIDELLNQRIQENNEEVKKIKEFIRRWIERWIRQTFEGIFFFKNVRYDSEIGAYIEEEDTTEDTQERFYETRYEEEEEPEIGEEETEIEMVEEEGEIEVQDDIEE